VGPKLDGLNPQGLDMAGHDLFDAESIRQPEQQTIHLPAKKLSRPGWMQFCLNRESLRSG